MDKKINNVLHRVIERYLIKGLNGMALGLFATLLIGTIFKQVGGLFEHHILGQFLIMIGQLGSVMMGAGIAVGVAHQLETNKLVLYASIVNGLIGAYGAKCASGSLIIKEGILLNGPGDPLGAFLAVIVGVECGKLVAGKTKLDILLTPAVTIFSGGLLACLMGPFLEQFTSLLGKLIETATVLQPLIMGSVVSILMGIFLTLPISSAAIGIILNLSGIAAGAATAGCCAQMVGFAVMSYRENKMNGLVAQGLGTSMLQMPNIIKNPRIWIPPILASAITGPIATVVFKLENSATGSGMGTSGLVGPFLMWQTMVEKVGYRAEVMLQVLLVCFILPALLTYLFSEALRKLQWITSEDLKLEL